VGRDQIAIVTGGASGIGRALAIELGRRGASVVVADRQAALAEEVAFAIERSGGRAVAAELDVRDAARFAELADETVERWGRIDLLFNNAGIAVGGEIGDYTVADWDDVLDVNVRGVAYGIQTVYPRMIAQRGGHIINTASMAGLVPATEGSYTASKYAVVGISKALRIDAARFGVKVSVLCPGAIRTPILTGGEYGRIKYDVPKEKIMAIWDRMRPMDPPDFARKALDAIERNEAIIVLPRFWKILWYLERVSPRASLKVWEVFFHRARAELLD